MIADDFLKCKPIHEDKGIQHLISRGYSLIEQLGTSQRVRTYIVQCNRKPKGYYCLVRVVPLDKNEQTPTLEIFQPPPSIPAVAHLLGGFHLNGRSYLIRQYIHGRSLTCEIPTQQGWTDSQVINLLKTILNPLIHCHQQGIVHGNLHPNNLIRQPNGQLILTDFTGNQGYYHQTLRPRKCGLKSNILGQLERQAYAAPEQWHGNHQPSSDIYALGMLGLQFLLGQQQWTSKKQLTYLLNMSPYQGLITILNRMVNISPDQRYTNAQAALFALGNVQLSAREPINAQLKEPGSAVLAQDSLQTPAERMRTAVMGSHAAVSPQSLPEPSELNDGPEFGGRELLSQELVSPKLIRPNFVSKRALALKSMPLVDTP